MGGLVRILVCVFFVWLYGGYALGGGTVALIATGILALFVNAYWRDQQRQHWEREHRDRVVADEQLRLDVQHRREREGRTKP